MDKYRVRVSLVTDLYVDASGPCGAIQEAQAIAKSTLESSHLTLLNFFAEDVRQVAGSTDRRAEFSAVISQ